VPIAHRTSVFDLTPAEWADTPDLLLRAGAALHDLLAPDGYLIGWNQGSNLHPHMHVIPRFDDEPLAALGGQRPGKQAARSLGIRERPGTPGAG
jgi:diadenosine tetraphosphate (Ap4A) HIT family hydrolase